MQCKQCETDGFKKLNHEGLCVSCAKAKFEANVRAAHKATDFISDAGLLTPRQSERFIQLVIEHQWEMMCREWLLVLAWESTLPDHYSSNVIKSTQKDEVWVTWRDLDEFMATGRDPLTKWQITPEKEEKIRSFLDDKLKGRHAPVELVPVDEDGLDDG
jgi:hypothetical protein